MPPEAAEPYPISTGNQSLRRRCPGTIPRLVDGGEVGPEHATQRASSPTSRNENARLRLVAVMPRVHCKVRK